MSTVDYYRLLDLPRSATVEDIKKAFRLKARQYHPDVSKDAFAAEHFYQLEEAYETLMDSHLRARYDALRAVEAAIAQVNERRKNRASTRFQVNQKPKERKRGLTPPVRLRPVRAHFILSLEEALYGATREFIIERLSKEGPGKHECMKLAIPPCTPSKEPLVLEAENNEGKRFPVHISLELELDPNYKLEEGVLVYSLFLYPWEFILGGRKPIMFFRETVYLHIAPATQVETRLRLKNLGLPGKDGQRAELLVQLFLKLPSIQTASQQSAWEHLRNTYEGAQ